jgi:transcriptional regulator with GAF, ATPase, and Fis domain
LQEGLTLYQSESPIIKDVMTLGQYVFEQDFASSRYIRDRKNPLFKHTLFISIPLMIENEIIGVLNINDNEKEFFNLGGLDFSLNVSEFVAISISNALLFEKVEKLSVTDGLTGLDNHQQMQSILKNKVFRCQRYASSLSLIMMDIGHFKNINDT